MNSYLLLDMYVCAPVCFIDNILTWAYKWYQHISVYLGYMTTKPKIPDGREL